MEKALPVGHSDFFTVLIDGIHKLLTIPQYTREDTITAARGTDSDGIKQGGLADSVLPDE